VDNNQVLEIERLFYSNFLDDLEDNPDHYEWLYETSIDKIKADPEYYYNLDVWEKEKELVKVDNTINCDGFLL
jgi:hypothetical protein